MSRIFISYRRQDSQSAAGRLADNLKAHFGTGQVFRDIETIEPGADFTESLITALNSCGVLIAIIGPRWLNATDRNGQRRIDDPKDLTRQEIEIALSRNIRVIPVLVEGAAMFEIDDLPKELGPLAKRQAYELTDKRWNQDISQFIATIEQILEIKRSSLTGYRKTRHVKNFAVMAALGLSLSALGSWTWFHWTNPSHVPGFDQEHARAISTKVSDALFPIINSNRFQDGGYGDGHIVTRADAWTSAQCLSSMFLLKDDIPDPEGLKATFAYIQKLREAGGDGRVVRTARIL